MMDASRGLPVIRQEAPFGCGAEKTSSGPETSSAGSVSVSRLTLSNFRCYAYQRLETDRRPVVLSGANGAGKTNILEALSLLVPGRGLRRARLSDIDCRMDGGMDRKNGIPKGPWAVAAHLGTPDGIVELGTGRDAASPNGRERRIVHIDSRPVKNQAELSRYLNVQWLTPSMDRMFNDGAATRRQFIDRLVFGFDPAHIGRVSAYGHALRERSRLLKTFPGGADANWLSALENTMAQKGVAVAAARRDVVSRLGRHCAAASGPFPGAGLEMCGLVDEWLNNGPALAAEDMMREALETSRSNDAESGGAAVGPHKSDFRVRHGLRDCPAEQCSTGEQKAMLIAIILANVRMQTAERGTLPVLLLDEVTAHLDSIRRDALFDEIIGLGVQAWLTGTDAAAFSFFGDRAQFFSVEDARINNFNPNFNQ